MAGIHRRTIQRGLNDPYNDDGVVTHKEPDILEFEVKWTLGSITINKASGGIKKQRHHFTSKGTYSQNCGFSRMW